jgi:hypothetical protein
VVPNVAEAGARKVARIAAGFPERRRFFQP